MTQYNLRSREILGELGVQYSPRQPLTNKSPLEALRKSVHLRTFEQLLAQENLKENESSNDESIESAKDQIKEND